MSQSQTRAKLTDNALTVLNSRYLFKDEVGKPTETPQALFERVASCVAKAEKGRDRARYEERFIEAMSSLRFLPNSPTLMNAGRPGGQLSACYVLPIEDSLDRRIAPLPLRTACAVDRKDVPEIVTRAPRKIPC